MRRLFYGLFIIAFAGAALAAQPVYTTAEKTLVVELHKRLKAKEFPEAIIGDMAKVYARRAYLVEVDPAESLAGEIIGGAGAKLPANDQLQYFGICLAAIARGTALVDVRTALKDILKDALPNERTHFIQAVIGSASRNASPGSILKIINRAGNNGLMGKKRQDFIKTITDQVDDGADPADLAAMYDAISKLSVSPNTHVEYMQRFDRLMRAGAPPELVVLAVERLSKKHDLPRDFEKDYSKITTAFASGTPFGEAVKNVVPDPK